MLKKAQKILIIEDDASLLNIMEAKLKHLGYSVLKALDGEEGFKKAEQIKPDLVLLDIVMPNLNGVEALKKIRKSDTIKNIKVIVLTNSGKENEKKEIESLGVEDYLVKSRLSLADIDEKIREVLGK